MTSKVKDDYEELNYCSLDFQSNVYSLAVINLKSGDKKLLAAPLRGNGLCIDMQHNVPIIKPIPFNPIPADCDLVSIDAMNQVARNGKIFIGITFTKSSESYLNIYSQESDADDADFTVDNLICCCQLKLEYVPLQLYHTEVFKGEDNIKSVFLLSGLDGKIHVYEESPRNNFAAVDVEEYFPEFATFTGFATCMKCVNLGRKTRLTSVGLRDGRSFAFVVDLEENKILKTYLTDHDDVITSLTIFSLNYHSDPSTNQDIANYNVLITTAFEQSVVYRRVFKSGFSLINVLAQSNLYDCCLCGVAVDLDLDGIAELVLGTYGKRLLYYKLLPLDPTTTTTTSTTTTTTTTTIATAAAASAEPTKCPTDPPATKPSATKIDNSNRNSNRDDPAAHLIISPSTSTSSTTTLKSLASSSSTSTILPAGSFSSIISHSLTSCRQSSTTITAPAAAAATTTTTKDDVLKAGIVANTSNNSSSNLGGDFINVPGDGDDADDNPDNDDDDDSQSVTSRNSVSQSEQLGFKLVEMKDLNEPIMALQSVDLTSDSLKELVVMTLKGVHILQKNLHNVMLILKERLNASPE